MVDEENEEQEAHEQTHDAVGPSKFDEEQKRGGCYVWEILFCFFFDDALWRGVSEVVIGRMRYRSVYGSKKERNAVGGGKRSQ